MLDRSLGLGRCSSDDDKPPAVRQQLVNVTSPVRGQVQLGTTFYRDGFAAKADLPNFRYLCKAAFRRRHGVVQQIDSWRRRAPSARTLQYESPLRMSARTSGMEANGE